VVKRARKPDPTPSRSSNRPLLAVVLTLGAAAALLFGLSRLGDEARRNIGPRDRYTVRFADIRCDPPPNTTRETFLTEVRYAAGAGPTVQALDPDLTPKLTAVFLAHPWVAGVDGVTVEPPNAVSAKLTYRTPVLVVTVDGVRRAVDGKGVLLPVSAPTANLPELLDPRSDAPEMTAGKPFPDETVVRAAAVAAEYKPKTIARTEQGWALVMPDGKKLAVGR
jgi:hypothetical protein